MKHVMNNVSKRFLLFAFTLFAIAVPNVPSYGYLFDHNVCLNSIPVGGGDTDREGV